MRQLFFLIFCFVSLYSLSQKSGKEVSLGIKVLRGKPGTGDTIRKIRITLRNNTDSLASFYESWNMWGRDAVKLELNVHNKIYCLFSAGDCWDQSYPSSIMLFPGDTVSFDFPMIECKRGTCPCFYSMPRGLDFPHKGLKGARLRALYSVNLENHQQEVLDSLKYASPYTYYYLMRPASHPKEFSKLSLERKMRSFVHSELISKPIVLTFDSW
jgi:hypothetical protein